MRQHNHKWNIWGRRITVLLLLCGLLLPIWPQSNAASVTYVYNWIKETAGLPTDDQWHDYFIAWEDTDDKNKVWFTDYHWYTEDGDSNIDVGGSSWMEYKAASTLPNNTAGSFTSDSSLGHMQIKYAGRDSDNGNAPKYYIRVSKMNGGYSYFMAHEPTNSEKEAEAFTFEDHGDVFHIFVNISGKADRYLTRDGQYLETTASSSVGGGDKYRPMRIYQRTFTIDESQEEAVGGDVTGKVDVYEYYWINEPQELLDLADNSKDWTDLVIAWKDIDTDEYWFTNEMWIDNGKPNYMNDYIGSRYAYWSNDTLGSGYTSANAESFIVPEKISHFQLKHVGWDDDNPIKGIKDAQYGMFDVDSPVFNIRFSISQNLYMYLGEKEFSTKSGDADTYTIQMFADDAHRNNNFGYVHIFSNWSWAEDEYLARNGNRVSLQEHNNEDDWQYYFRIYTYRMVEYDAIVKSFTVGKGATYSIDKQLVLAKDVTITVEDGGVLMVDRQLLNNGNIVVKEGGTVIVNEGGYIMPFGENVSGKITLDGGSLIVMDGAKVLCDQGDGTLLARNGATIINRGVLLVSKALELRNNSYLRNESTGVTVFGGVAIRNRGAVSSVATEQFDTCVTNTSFTLLCSSKSKILNKGTVSISQNSAAVWDPENNSGIIDKGKTRKR
jgi:hypothetical protein